MVAVFGDFSVLYVLQSSCIIELVFHFLGLFQCKTGMKYQNASKDTTDMGNCRRFTYFHYTLALTY